ncbi:type 4a pilus biogenesis protein PilO [Desulfoscipio geothermicus]|uniref:Pilus assembly protein, PilO n=1 Tax=Desulfoscipio geothermicus DSM 3669 TaxID=1121426 RepID=A0A1I6DBK3_9FIRM|nr:type II secretion system protein GspM [Desulfoscipio geothermicus]SFR02836.1 Pilus assembly protein, PilO [Desulfoscipio geothermicus DSM 3669]
MWQNLSSREKAMLMVLGIIILLAGFYYFLLKPQLDAYALVTGQLAVKQAELQKAELTLRAKKMETKKAAAVREQLADYTPLFDTEFRQGSAMVLIGLKAADLQVTVSNLEPAGIVDRESYLVLPVKLGLKGNYTNVLTLLNEIEKLPNLVEIRTMDIKADDAGNAAGESSPTGGLPTPGKVQCASDLLIYSDPTPEGRLYLAQEKIMAWRVGRPDPFAIPERVAPYPGASLPPVPAGGGPETTGPETVPLPAETVPGGVTAMPPGFWDKFFEALIESNKPVPDMMTGEPGVIVPSETGQALQSESEPTVPPGEGS